MSVHREGAPAASGYRGSLRAAFSLSAALALLLVATVPGCGHKEPGPEPGRAWLDAFNSHNADQVVKLMSPNATYWDPATPQPIAPAALRARLEAEARLWKDRVYTARQILVTQDAIVVEWHLQQTHPSNGEPVPLDGVTVLELRNNLIQAARTYYDPSVYLRFMARH